MRKGIVITTSAHTREWFLDCLNSVGNKYPVLIVFNGSNQMTLGGDDLTIISNDWNGFELGGILRGKENFDEFVHLMDTTVIKDPSLFDKLFEIPGHVFLTDGGYHYMGKFVSADLPEIPKISTKADAIALELQWLKRPYTCFTPNLPVHTDVFVDKHGRKNMVLENEYMTKYKATWSI